MACIGTLRIMFSLICILKSLTLDDLIEEAIICHLSHQTIYEKDLFELSGLSMIEFQISISCKFTWWLQGYVSQFEVHQVGTKDRCLIRTFNDILNHL